MKCRRGALLVSICLAYGLVSLYTAYIAQSRPTRTDLPSAIPGEDALGEGERKSVVLMNIHEDPQPREVVIWDTCGLGIYLWKNILHGKITRYNLINGWTHDSLKIDGLKIQYNLGYDLPPDKALTPASSNVVLIINSRTDDLINTAKAWLDHALKSAYIKQVAIMLLGSESCDNEWVLPYLQQSRIKCLFLVYDSPLVDDELVYQWPLGAASYRDLHNRDEEFVDLAANRKYVFNFVDTTYEKSSRMDMVHAIKRFKNESKYFIKTQNRIGDETPEDIAMYQNSLLESDLTITPVGRNPECYRTYEAMAMGSIPVVEDVLTEGTCGDYEDEKQGNYTPPHRLLKRYNAPVLYVKNWDIELPAIIKRFADMPERTKFYYRINLIRWYVDFKNIMKEKFLSVIRSKFSMI